MTADRPAPVSDEAALTIDELDVIAPAAFAARVGPLFEGARGFLGRLAVARPFGTIEAMFDRSRAIAHTMPRAEQIELVDAHPRLGADPAAVSALSFVEQGYAAGALEAPHAAEAERARVAEELDRLNAAYEARFGFRYCVFVAGRNRAELLPELTTALDADPGTELHRALDAVVDIAWARYATLTGAPQEGHR